ncbi:hypothetical protein IV203_005177 [Nitzschia inconspicua]|uniref:Uncharacterized protein n=1 Tax=Nitzschia inconspicua TaxID=303405 RepID=A0A9K3PIF3_9STRA|nr:hypothetical protein IV203_005177 [Nitzschia inconspicua]
MGLFSTLAASSTAAGDDGQSHQPPSVAPNTLASSSAQLPTLVQLYTDHKPILLEQTSKVTGYTTMTYQAVQVGASQDVELKNRHVNPDLGVWNCHVQQPTKRDNNATSNAAATNDQPSQLVDSLLAKVSPQASAYCLTVDLSEESKVEPNLNLLQSTLVRHLIEHPPIVADPATVSTETEKTKTTNLYDLQVVQFGLASNDKGTTEQKIDEASKDVVVSVMICAILPPEDDPTEVSEQAYKKKQARALVIYHLRKFANAINAALCFVRDEEAAMQEQWQADLATAVSKDSLVEAATSFDNTNTAAAEDTQPAISYEMLSNVWYDLAMGIPVWLDDAYTIVKDVGNASVDADSSEAVTTTALYGPGKQQEDLIESVLLRNANYPGHWDASKESLWVALPAPSEPAPPANTTKTGDEGWLTQLRESIASALPPEKATPKAEEGNDEKPKEKDAAVSSFFESLLKNP